MADSPLPEFVRWRAIDPELTHFHDIISLDFDLGVDRGTSDTYAPVELPPAPGEQWPWQRAVLTFWGGPLDREHRHAIPVRCTFDGVVYLKFLQDDAQPALGQDGTVPDIYHVSGLRGVPGFGQQYLSEDTRGWGAFCLWESEDSALLREIVQRAGRYSARSNSVRPWLRHFRTSCDELGTLEIIAGAVTVERIEVSP